MRVRRVCLLVCAVMVLPLWASNAYADKILLTELAGFAVLGGQTVTNTGATTLTGNLGVNPGLAITGQNTITVNGTNAAAIGNPSVYHGGAVGVLAQSQLAAAKITLGLLGPGSVLGVNLAGLTLGPGVYTVASGVSNLTGALTLNGMGNANATWVFQMPGTLITSPGSVVNVINTGAGAGVYWNVGSSATLDTTTSFQGNILALTSITLNHGATIGCGRALANIGSVTMNNNTIGAGCTGILAGTNGLGGSLAGPTDNAPVPEPGTFLLFAPGIAWLVSKARQRRAKGLLTA